MNRRYATTSFILAMGTLLAAGCTGDPAGPSTSSVSPKLGSTFTFAIHDIDSNGVKVPGSDESFIASVVNGDTTILGKSGAIVIGTDGGTDRIPFKIESNGDVSIITSEGYESLESGVTVYRFMAPSAWVTLPFSSRKKEETVVYSYDTTATVRGEPAGFSVRQTVAYVGDEEITIGTKKLNASKVIVKPHREHYYGTLGEKVDMTESIWFSPEIGYVVKTIGERRSDESPAFNGWVMMLTDYTLK